MYEAVVRFTKTKQTNPKSPYMLSLLAQMDDRGRWVVATDAVWRLGAAVGGMMVKLAAIICSLPSHQLPVLFFVDTSAGPTRV